MKTMTIRNIAPDVHLAIKQRAVEHGHSAEQEVRRILAAAARRPHLADILRDIGTRLNGLPEATFEVPRDKRAVAVETFD